MVYKPSCYRCNATGVVKSGFVSGRQRWKCKACGLLFTRANPPGSPSWWKLLASFLHGMGIAKNRIANLFGVSRQTVAKWVAESPSHFSDKSLRKIVEFYELDNLFQGGSVSAGVLAERKPVLVVQGDLPFQKSVVLTIQQED